MIGLSKEDVERIIRDCNIDHECKEIAGTLRAECHELNPMPEYKELPQTVFVQEGTVINISDGDNRGKWVSTKEGWIPLK